jgi:hypothetical protein
MGVRITRVAPVGPGSTNFRFRNHADPAADQREYDTGRKLEEARHREGSLAHEIYLRLSVSKPVSADTTEGTHK